MALTAGSRLGPYEILALLGAGGMGEVYRARDTKLHRDVAIKVLPEDVATDPDRLARFEREAQALAALNHPNIASVYAVEDRAIVMELVAGEDLSARIQRAPIPLAEALPLARQIADALAAAHEAGIIHRDLKPANIKVKDDGTAKVLDFGLAKALAPEDASATPDAMNSPTISAHATRRGVILGTAAYMAPEQARGKAVDKRADIWAFGVVLYEMLAGKRLFAADEVSDTLAHVLTKEPDWTALPTATPPRIRELLRHCLTKDVRQRLHDIADARLEIDDAIGRATEPQAAGPLSVRQLRRERLAWTAAVTVLAAALAIAGGLAYHGRGAHPASPAVARFFIGVAPAEELGTSSTNEGRPAQTAMALSPDGRTLVFSAIRGEQRQLFRRDLAQLEAVPMAGTEGADSPFFSPDGNWVGFRAGGALRKVAVNGGPATMICETAAIYGASWGPNDTIVYAGDRGGLWLVPSSGGTPQAVTALDAAAGEFSHRLPQFLPDGKAVVFTVVDHYQPDWKRARLSVVSLPSGERKDLGQGADARYAASGHLVFVRSGTLLAAPFDPSARVMTGSAIAILDDVMQSGNAPATTSEIGAGQFSLSASGSLVYLTGGIFPDREGTLVSVDRRGGEPHALPCPVRPYIGPRLSPDGRQLLVWTRGVDRNVWTCDIARGTLTRLTRVGRNSHAIWTPDGKRITFAGSSEGADRLFWMAADGSGSAEPLTTGTTPGRNQIPSSWSSDGRTLLFAGQGDVMAISLDGDRRPTPILATPSVNEYYPEFSPDGRFLAYVSNESGRDEVYVRPYPGPGAGTPISNAGGSAPAWSQDGRELFYVVSTSAGGMRMMAVPIKTTPSFTVGTPSQLFDGRYGTASPTRGYDVTGDGQRFYLTQVKERPPIRVNQMILVQNWFEELKARVPSGR